MFNKKLSLQRPQHLPCRVDPEPFNTSRQALRRGNASEAWLVRSSGRLKVALPVVQSIEQGHMDISLFDSARSRSNCDIHLSHRGVKRRKVPEGWSGWFHGGQVTIQPAGMSTNDWQQGFLPRSAHSK